MVRSLAAFALLTLANGQMFTPWSVDFASLQDGKRGSEKARTDKALANALRTDGVLAITGIPEFAKLREEVLKGAHSCIVTAPHAQSLDFPDGTTRQTLAGTSTSKGQEAIEHGSGSSACQKWEHTSATFRKMVADAVDVFAKRLNAVLNINSGVKLLQTRAGHSYDDLEAVVAAGQRLEHFHTYTVPKPLGLRGDEPIIDYHVDQGLFIAFAPALLVDDAASPVQKSLPTGTFMIKTKDGAELEAEFDADSLVILLGDGVNQYLNNLQTGLALHAPVHAFRMPRGMPAGLHRVWYGLMQLPPSDAKSGESGLTFGEIRAKVIGNPQSPLGLGCSQQMSARELSAPSVPSGTAKCASNQLYCWHRCMNYTASVSPTACAAKSMGFNCTSQFDQIYQEKDGHGDFNMACTNATEFVQPRPVVLQPTGTCNGWQELVSDTSYTHRVALVADETYFLWNVDGNKIEGKMVTKGLVGWMAIGTENIGGKHKGMNGGRVVMGLNDPATSPSIGERKIHEGMTAFRHWKTPLNPSALENASMSLTSCFSSIQFKTKTIYGEVLNVTQGTNHLIWGLTHLAYSTSEYGGYAAYHSAADGDRSQTKRFRGHVHLDFASGLVITTPPPTTTTPTSASQPTAELSKAHGEAGGLLLPLVLMRLSLLTK